MSTEFFLVRHAEKEKHVGDVSISPEGIKQLVKQQIILVKCPLIK